MLIPKTPFLPLASLTLKAVNDRLFSMKTTVDELVEAGGANVPDIIEYDVVLADEGDTVHTFAGLIGFDVYVFFDDQKVRSSDAIVDERETFKWDPLTGDLTKWHGYHETEHITLIPYKLA